MGEVIHVQFNEEPIVEFTSPWFVAPQVENLSPVYTYFKIENERDYADELHQLEMQMFQVEQLYKRLERKMDIIEALLRAL